VPSGLYSAHCELRGRAGKSPERKVSSTVFNRLHVGLFITIALVGIVCALLGRMLGDVGSYWTILVGAILIWVALDMMGLTKCSMSGSLLSRIKIKGLLGAFALGLAYGVLSAPARLGLLLQSWPLSPFNKK